jgi:hypothetical protein
MVSAQLSGQSMTLTGVGESTHRRGRHLWDNLATKALAMSDRLHWITFLLLAKHILNAKSVPEATYTVLNFAMKS